MRRIMSNDAISYLRGSQVLLFLKTVSRHRLLHTDKAGCSVIVLKATVQAFVSNTQIAVAIARELCDGLRDFFNRLVNLPRVARKLFGR